MKDNPEILVHISAPSGAKNDARYRAQVEAILGFQAATRRNIYNDDNAKDVDDIAAVFDESHREVISVNSSHPSPIQLRPEPNLDDDLQNDISSQVGGADGAPGTNQELSSQCGRTSLTVTEQQTPSRGTSLSSPKTSHGRPQQQFSEHDSWPTPLSTIPDSQPDYLNREAQAQGDSGKVPAETPRISSPSNEDGTPCANRKSAKRTAATFPPKPLIFTPHRLKRRRAHSSPVLQSNAPQVAASPGELDAFNSPVNRRPSRSELAATIDLIPSSTRNSSRAPSSRALSLDLLPQQVHPPAPPVSTSSFVTHITPALQLVAQRLRPVRNYKPMQQSRELDRLERGYWHLRLNIITATTTTADLDSADGRLTSLAPRRGNPAAVRVSDHTTAASGANCWDFPFFCTFWSFLADFISEGRAGWGVWCILDNDEDHTNNALAKQDKDLHDATSQPPASPSDSLVPPHRPTPNGHCPALIHTAANRTAVQAEDPGGSAASCNPLPAMEVKRNFREPSVVNKPVSLKIYTWGEAVSHTYLLLYLASERRVRHMGAQWRDSREEVVVQMP